MSVAPVLDTGPRMSSPQENKRAVVVHVTGMETPCVRAMKEMMRERASDDPEARVARLGMRWFLYPAAAIQPCHCRFR